MQRDRLAAARETCPCPDHDSGALGAEMAAFEALMMVGPVTRTYTVETVSSLIGLFLPAPVDPSSVAVRSAFAADDMGWLQTEYAAVIHQTGKSPAVFMMADDQGWLTGPDGR